MARVRVDCVRLDGPDPDYRIDMLGGPQPDGSGKRYLIPIDDMIAHIRKGEHSFYTDEGGRVAEINVYQHPVSRRYYLQTDWDGYPPNNLLNLGRCP